MAGGLVLAGAVLALSAYRWVQSAPSVKAARASVVSAEDLLEDARGDQELRASVRLFNKSMARFPEEAVAEEPGLLVRVLHGRARANLRLGFAAEAVPDLERARGLLEASEDRHRLLEVLGDLAKARRRAGDPSLAEPLYRRAYSLASTLGDKESQAAMANGLGLLHASLGEMDAALVQYQEALELWRAIGDTTSEATGLHNLGVHLSALGFEEDAAQHLHLAIQRKEESSEPQGSGQVESLAVSWTALGAVLRQAEKPVEARKALDSALNLWRQVGDLPGKIVTLEQSALLEFEQGRAEAALDLLSQAVDIAEGDEFESAFVALRLAEVELALGRFAAAVGRLEDAIPIFVGRQAPHGEILARTLISRGLRELGRREDAIQQLETALRKVDEVRGELRGRALRASYAGERFDATEELIDLWMDAESDRARETAWRLREQARARSLLEAWTARSRPETNLELAGQATETLLALAGPSQVGRNATVESTDADESIVVELIALDRARAPNPDLPTEPPDVIGLSDASRLVDRDTVALVFSLGNRRSFLWRIDADGYGVTELPAAGEIQAVAERLHRSLSKPEGLGRSAQRQLDLKLLSNMLFGGLGELDSTRRLLIVPDGALHQLPLGVLPFRGADPLLTQFEVTQVPSLTLLRALRLREKRRPQASSLLALLADPVFSSSDVRLAGKGSEPVIEPESGDETVAVEARQVTRALGSDLRRLHWSAKEADNLRRLAERHGKVLALRGFEVERSAILRGALGDFRIVHFATHSWIDERHPDLSSIVLSLYDRQGLPQPGLLRAGDLAMLRLDAELAVLSACRTGLGREIDGEGLLGLTHAFFLAGANRVLVSLWDVDDRATAELMSHFYEGLWTEGLSPEAALRNAQLQMRRSGWSDPYYWAAFVLQGDGEWGAGGTTR